MRKDLVQFPALRARLEKEPHLSAAQAIGWGIETRTGKCRSCNERRDLTYLGLCGSCFKEVPHVD